MKTPAIFLLCLFGVLSAPTTLASDPDTSVPPATLTFPVTSTDNEFLAAAGCCKERRSKGKPWRRIKKDLDGCKAINEEKDNDNVFRPSGRFWWDVGC